MTGKDSCEEIGFYSFCHEILHIDGDPNDFSVYIVDNFDRYLIAFLMPTVIMILHC